jgi:hypothetical protein
MQWSNKCIFIFGVIGIINSEEEKQSVVKHLINNGVYKVKDWILFQIHLDLYSLLMYLVL